MIMFCNFCFILSLFSLDIYWHCRLSQDRADKKTLTENKNTAENMMHRIDITARGLMTYLGLRTSVSVVLNGVRNVWKRL